MRSFPPSYISNAPGHPNPHLAATYMANLNKAAAYAAAAAASRHSVMTATAAAAAAAGPNYGPQTPMATSVTSQEDLRLQQEPYGGHNIYAVSFKYLPIFIFCCLLLLLVLKILYHFTVFTFCRFVIDYGGNCS